MTDNDSAHGPPNFPGYAESYGSSGEEMVKHQPAIFTSYNLVDVNPDMSHGGECPLNQQVWRPPLTVEGSNGTSCYSLVGNNSVISDIVPPGVAIVTPSPQEFMPSQPGDVLGMCVEEASRSNDSVVRLTESGFTNELAPDMTNSQNESSAGSDEVLNSSTNAAPVISVASGKYIAQYIIS